MVVWLENPPLEIKMATLAQSFECPKEASSGSGTFFSCNKPGLMVVTNRA
jgi:hypothetical protein